MEFKEFNVGTMYVVAWAMQSPLIKILNVSAHMMLCDNKNICVRCSTCTEVTIL